MFKFLRKYNKWILAVGGTLLMIVFLIPQALENMAQRAGVARATRATVGPEGRERVPVDAWSQILQEYEFLDRASRVIGGQLLPGLGMPDDAGHWYLLVREAEAAGLIGSTRALQLSEDQLRSIAGFSGTSPRIVLSAEARREGVVRLLHLYTNAGELSDRRLLQYASRMFHRVETRIIPIEASAEESMYDPTEEELQAQLDAYGTLAPGEGEMGFGYRLPNRVKLEWIEVPAEAVRRMVLAGEEMDNIALRRHWLRESRRPDSTLPPVEEGAAIPEAVREHLLEKLTGEKLQEIERFANDQVRTVRRGLRTIDGYHVLPEDWDAQRAGFPALAEQIQARFEIELPTYRSTGEWMEIDELIDLPGIGRSTTDRFGVPRSLRELVRAVKEFGGSPVIQVQAGVAGPPMRGRDGSVYLFRILEADPERPPTSIDEVRHRLVEDIRRRAHYQVLVETASQFEQEAIENGMMAAALDRGAGVSPATVALASRDALRFQQQFGLPIEATPEPLPGVGVSKAASEAIIDYVLSLPQDVPFHELPGEQRIFTVPVDDALTVLVVELVRNIPLTRAAYTELAGDNTIKSLILGEELGGGEFIRAAFGYDVLAARHNFQLHIIREVEEDFSEVDLGG